jgi:glycosyltransferase involved in cell wall biosynthesis
MRPLRILQLADHSEILSGGAVQMLLLARGLRDRGHDVTCVFHTAPAAGEHTLAQVERAGLRLVRLPLDNKSGCPALADLVAHERFDVIHTHRGTYKVLLRSCRDGALPPVVVNRGQSRPIRSGERRKMLHPAVRAHIAVAAHVRDVLVAAGVPAERVHVVYGSYDPERFDPRLDGRAVRREILNGAHESGRLVGIVAKLSHYKSHDVFLAAAAAVLRAAPDTHFAVVGPDPDDVRPALAALAQRLGNERGVPLGARLRFTGARDDIPNVLAALDVSVSASATAWEGLSGVMRESLAMARPVVCTDVGGNRELVRDGDTGRLVPPGDPAALAAAILDLLADPDRARAMAARGHRLAVTTFSNAARAQAVEAIYARVLAEAGDPS